MNQPHNDFAFDLAELQTFLDHVARLIARVHLQDSAKRQTATSKASLPPRSTQAPHPRRPA